MEAGRSCGVLMPDVWQRRMAAADPQRAANAKPAVKSKKSLQRHVNQTIENEIVPRLMMAHKIGAQKHEDIQLDGYSSQQFTIDSHEIEHFAALAVTQGFGICYAYIDTLRARGLGLQDIFLELMSPAAQYLGRLWEQDLCDFTDVTIGLGCLQQLVQAISAESHYVCEPTNAVRSVLLAPSPGEQHTFGLTMLSEFFYRGGWQVTKPELHTGNEIIGAVRTHHFDVVGLSASGADYAENMTGLIRDIRKSSRNKAITVMVGGHAFQEAPAIVKAVGADATALNGREALFNASKLLDSIDVHCSEESDT